MMRRCKKHHRHGYGQCPGCRHDEGVQRIHEMLVHEFVRWVKSGIPLNDFLHYFFEKSLD
jgi:hypothetical protein